MSGLDLQAVHEALADQIRNNIADAGNFTIKAYPSTADRPVVEVWPDANYVTYWGTYGAAGISEIRLVVRLLLSGANPETEWKTVARLLNAGTAHPSSILDAVHADVTLGSVVENAFIGDATWNPEDGAVDIPVIVRVKKSGASV